MRSFPNHFLVGLAGLGLLWALTAAAQSPEHTSVSRGKEHFRIFCANCHGVDARGSGPVAAMLEIQPADLTRLTGEDGHFDSEKVFNAVDGRHRVGEEKNMPVFTDNLEFGTVLDIVAYLKTVQR